MKEAKKHIDIAKLIFRNKLGVLSESEQKALNDWLSSSQQNQDLYNQLCFEEVEPMDASHKNDVWNKLERASKGKKRMVKFLWTSVAASIAVLFGIGYWMLQSNTSEEVLISQVATVEKIISNKKIENTVLILSTGEMIELNKSTFAGGVCEVNGVVLQMENGILKYRNKSGGNNEELFNSIVTPRGKTQEVILADGTHVWLNADSKITYPVSMKGKKRPVDLNGEAYFEVTHNKTKPFQVNVDDYLVEVLGTSFNVDAYSVDHVSKTTLVEGRVKIDFQNNRKDILLAPNEQVSLDKKIEKVKVEKVKSLDIASWRHGRFVFRKQPLSAIMKTFARWYDVEVKYENELLKDLLLTMNIERYSDVNDPLTIISSTNKVLFELKDRIITVKQK
ncbi:FecR family protein [Prolixibacteraceae bacterium JC049]|nr:FecR family protein [Prolixibacteraceae bacterium JC049]